MFTNRALLLITFVLFIGSTFPVQAADLSVLINGQFDATSKKDRAKIARDLLAEIQKLFQYLPTQKPQEAAWLKQEKEAIGKLDQAEAVTSRRVQMAMTPEFQQEKLHSTLTAIQDTLACAADPSSSLSREMMCWSVASFLLTDRAMFDDSISILLKAGRLPRDVEKQAFLGSESLGFGYFYDVLWGRGIQEHIVIPYLKGQTK